MSASPDDRFAGLVGASHQGWKPEDDLDDLVPGNRPVPARVIIVSVAVVVVLAVVGLIIFTALKQSPDPAGEAAGAAEPGPPVASEVRPEVGSTANSPASEVTVHVAGEVKNPGVMTLPAGSRVTDAVQAAGGMTHNADPSALNLAQPLNDGEQIKVPRVGEPEVSSGASGSSDGAPSGESGAGKINVNTASEKELQELPGVGPATSEAIIKHREENGRFETIEQLDDVPGIGPAILERLTPLVTV
ncbi:helix-hairpin-helix domain-containing protein [Brevibacterium sp. UMB10442]|nr:helix-hairpin-helix domain-containing protein [Brevibacterium sp. UMB10442]